LVALPKGREDAELSFEHHGKESLQVIESGGASIRVVLGHARFRTITRIAASTSSLARSRSRARRSNPAG
jgi:hypothetical protein